MTVHPRLRGCALAAAVSLGAAAPAAAATNATVTNGNVHLRQSYPTFDVSTLFKFRLSPGESLAIISEGTRVTVLARKVVETSEWFQVEHSIGRRRLNGWVYAGEVGDRRYIALDRGVEGHLRTAATSRSSGMPFVNALAFRALAFGPVLDAQQGTVDEPDIQTRVLPTLGLGLAHVVILVASMAATKRWVFPTSDTYTLATSVFFLLALRVISGELANDLFARLISGR